MNGSLVILKKNSTIGDLVSHQVHVSRSFFNLENRVL